MPKSLLWHQFSLLYPAIASTYLLNPSNIGFIFYYLQANRGKKKKEKRILLASKSIINMRLLNFLSSSHFSLYLDFKKKEKREVHFDLKYSMKI